MTEQYHGGAAVTDTILHVLQTMQDQLNRMEAAMIPRPEYEAFKVTHKDQRWTSDLDGNVWEPGVYGWTLAP